ncbi:lipoprotein [Psychromonas sp.]|uniref:LptM family lipoprotein n=1 Tax=Psychromonas sp. TaxID=1884585 RepID=UPI003564EC52
MKSIKLLITNLLFVSLLAGCGMSGPLYRTPKPAPAAEQQNTAPEEVQSSRELLDSDAIKASASE